MTEKPLTDEELATIERLARDGSEWRMLPHGVLLLASEVRRLRSELANARSVVSADTAELHAGHTPQAP